MDEPLQPELEEVWREFLLKVIMCVVLITLGFLIIMIPFNACFLSSSWLHLRDFQSPFVAIKKAGDGSRENISNLTAGYIDFLANLFSPPSSIEKSEDVEQASKEIKFSLQLNL